MKDLTYLGWNDHFAREYEKYSREKFSAGRIIGEYQDIFKVATAAGEMLGDISGKLRHEAGSREDFPVIGDWVLIPAVVTSGRTLIHKVLVRQNKISRKDTNENNREQIIAANITTLFIVMSLDENYNLKRLERYLVMAYDSGVRPVVILNKKDLCDNLDIRIAEVTAASPGTAVHALCSTTRSGYEELSPYLTPGTTTGFVGSSGVGKSTIINNLLGRAVQRTADVRKKDSKGRHTTTNRCIFLTPGGSLLLDTPGMRELEPWEAGAGLGLTFEDVDTIAVGCRFSNCRHETEPDCAVRTAVESGQLDTRRLESFRKLQQEQKNQGSKEDRTTQLNRRSREKIIHSALQQRIKKGTTP